MSMRPVPTTTEVELTGRLLPAAIGGGRDRTVWDDEERARSAYLEESEDAEEEPSEDVPELDPESEEPSTEGD